MTEFPEDLPVPARPGRSRTSTVTGTVSAGFEPNCLLLNGFLLVGGDRSLIRPGARITVTGRVDRTVVTTCQQGIPFVVSRVERA